MRRASVLEGVNVRLNLGDIDGMMFGSFTQQNRVMDTLSSTQDLFSSHEHVIRVGPSLVIGVRHGVEGTGGQGKLVQNVEVGVVLLTNNLSKLLLVGSVQVFKFRLLNTGFLKKFSSFSKSQNKRFFGEDERFRRILLGDSFDLRLVFGLNKE